MNIPDYIRSINPASFSNFTIQTRFPKILDNIVQDNQLGDSKDAILELKSNIDTLKIEQIPGSQFALFNESITPFLGLSIYEAPFFITEMFFYQKIAQILKFHENHHDYFRLTKLNGLKACNAYIDTLSGNLAEIDELDISPFLSKALLYALWGNLADLSLFTLENTFNHQNSNDDSADNILINNSSAIVDRLLQHTGSIHIFLDNTGFELISDLYLIAVLLQATTCNIIVHVKPIPMFVSDTTQQDWDITLTHLKQVDNIQVNEWSNKIMTATNSGRVTSITQDFWASGYSFSDEWFASLGIDTKDIVISKGDLNYRRYFQDRMWNYTTPTNEASFVKQYKNIAIRTLKSEIMTNLNDATVTNLNQKDKDWLINGKYGLIQLF